MLSKIQGIVPQKMYLIDGTDKTRHYKTKEYLDFYLFTKTILKNILKIFLKKKYILKNVITVKYVILQMSVKKFGLRIII